MIITKEEFINRTKTYEDFIDLVEEADKEVHKFYVYPTRLVISRTFPETMFDGISIPLSKESYVKAPISRGMLMTDDEYLNEVKAGRIEGVYINELGNLCF